MTFQIERNSIHALLRTVSFKDLGDPAKNIG